MTHETSDDWTHPRLHPAPAPSPPLTATQHEDVLDRLAAEADFGYDVSRLIARPYPLTDPHGFVAREDTRYLCRFCSGLRGDARHLQEPADRETGHVTTDDPLHQYVRSPMNIALHWNEELLLWEVTVRFHGRRLGVTQVSKLDDLGSTVFDYVALASAEPLNPDAAVTRSLLPHDANLTVARIRDVITDFGQLDTPGANDQVTALSTIELIDELLDADDVRLPASVEDYAHEIVHDQLCGCPGADGYLGAQGVCPQVWQVTALVSKLDAAGVLVHRQPMPRESISDTAFQVDERVEYLSGVPYLGRITTIITGDPETGTTYHVKLNGTVGTIAVTDVNRLRRPRADL